MKYILKDGYIDEITFGATIECKNQTCTEYTGTIPNNYSSLEEWVIGEEGKLNAWKIVDGNLVFDENKYNELQDLWEVEEEENSLSTHKWTREQLTKTSSVVTDEFSKSATGANLVLLEDSGEYAIPKVIISSDTTITDNLKVGVSNKNLLGNNAVTTTVNGVTFTINNDKSITLNGTSTDAIEFLLDGTIENTEMLFLIKENMNYIKSGLTSDVGLNLYNYDGTDTTLISNGGNGIINLSTGSIITRSTLSVASGVTFNDVTISPQLEIGTQSTEYVQHFENSIIINLGSNQLNPDDYILIDNSNIKLVKTTKRKKKLADVTLYSYDPSSIIYVNKAVDIDVEYFTYKFLDKALSKIEVKEKEIIQSVSNVSNQTTKNTNSLNELKENQESSNTTLSELQLTVNNISNTVQIQGGANLVDNSVMLYGTDLYTITDTQSTEGTILSGKITELVGKTISEAGYILQNKKVVHDTIKGFIPNKQYTLTFKYSNQENNNLKVVLDNLENETILNTTENKTLEEVVYTFTAKTTEISYSIESNYADDELVALITDFIIKSGNVRNDWEPAKTEIIGTNLVIYYNGVEITSPSQKLKTKINNLGFVVVNTDNNSNVLECTKDGIITSQITLNGALKQDVFTMQALVINGDNHLIIS